MFDCLIEIEDILLEFMRRVRALPAELRHKIYSFVLDPNPKERSPATTPKYPEYNLARRKHGVPFPTPSPNDRGPWKRRNPRPTDAEVKFDQRGGLLDYLDESQYKSFQMFISRVEKFEGRGEMFYVQELRILITPKRLNKDR